MSNLAIFDKIVDISGPIHLDMWHYPDPYFKPEIYPLAPVDWLPEPVYSEAIHMPLQTGTYVETVAHVRPDGIKMNEVPLERTVLLPTVCVQLIKGAGEAVHAEELRSALDAAGPGPWSGFGLLVATGWDTHWDDADYLTDCPFFDESAIEVVLEAGFSLFGGDSPRFENPAAPSGHLRRFFASGALLLAPLCHLTSLGSAIGHVIAAPLPISEVSASPVRAVWVSGLGSQT